MKSVALAGAALSDQSALAGERSEALLTDHRASRIAPPAAYPRVLHGSALAMVSFPLGGIGAGSVGLGGRGQLRDWEIFNRPDKGNSLSYAFPSLRVHVEGEKPIAHVLEARIEPPYEGQDGLGANNVPGLSRLQGATFKGEFPLAHVEFQDDRLPLKIRLEAGTPFIPLDADASGLPLAALHYRVRNTGAKPVSVSIAFSIDNPVKERTERGDSDVAHRKTDSRLNQWRRVDSLQGLFMTNPAIGRDAPEFGTFAVAVTQTGNSKISGLTGWPAGRWWNSPLLFWDDFVSDGELGPEAEKTSAVGAVCSIQTIAPGAEAEYSFLLAWHFPNRTPDRCGWDAPREHEHTVIGNWYAEQFSDAWAVVEFAIAKLPDLEKRTAAFAKAMRLSTLPSVVKEAAMSNLSTLVSTTCFRTADGEFHGFEGVSDHRGCCFGNCTHVWNYESTTAHLFPSLSRSLRKSAFGYSMDERGAMYFRQLLPDGIERFGYVAADGQMGQIMKVYLDWQLSGDAEFLKEFWAKAKRALEFAWVPGGWDADRDGVMEGVQHNTYDVEFYGPNPLCSIYYLGALRAAEEMARASGEANNADEYRRIFESGRRWLDGNLFNGEYYVQIIQGRSAESIAPGLRSGMGADDPETPEFQVGGGCLVDQLLGQYMAHICGLGTLVDNGHLQKALAAVYRYNHKPHLYDHDTVQRTFALNDEAALVICDYGKGERPRTPFPYYAEVMTGFEYSAATLMLFEGMADRGLECIADIRRRYDGVRRNPWDEAECGHHYARAMAAWTGVLAVSGFQYRGADGFLTVMPGIEYAAFQSFWSTGTGWGTFTLSGRGLSIEVTEGFLHLREVEMRGNTANRSAVRLGNAVIKHAIQIREERLRFSFVDTLRVQPGHKLVLKTERASPRE